MEPNGAPMARLALSSATSSTWLNSRGESIAEAISATTVSSSMRCRRFLAAMASACVVSSLARLGGRFVGRTSRSARVLQDPLYDYPLCRA